MSIHCAKGHYHEDIAATRACWLRPPAFTPVPVQRERVLRDDRSKSKVPWELLKHVPDGYYAVASDDTTSMVFLRMKRVKNPTSSRNRPKYPNGTVKIQTKHGEDLVDAWIKYPDEAPDNGRLVIEKYSVEQALLLLVLDHKHAAKKYADEIGCCCRCNKDLTDPRSRHYGIGPDCEEFWPDIVSMVDDENDGVRFEDKWKVRT